MFEEAEALSAERRALDLHMNPLIHSTARCYGNTSQSYW